MSRKKTIEEFQETLDNLYGSGVWTALTYEGSEKQCVLRHKCGEEKHIRYAKNVKSKKLLCSCDPIPAGLKERYNEAKVKKEDLQADIDKIYGEGTWTILEFSGMAKPLRLEHSCGETKTISRAMNVKKGNYLCRACKC